MYSTRFNVKGNGSFPIDMLRYDACHPSVQASVTNIYDDRAERTVQLTQLHGHKLHHITDERWASFGWQVTNIFPTVKV